MDIREYTTADLEACLAVFDSNTPDLLPGAARPVLEKFLENAPAFFVAEHDGMIVGCGGYSIHGDAARLHWGMVHRQWQRQGLGRFLLFYRLREITKHSAVQMVGLETPRIASGFFQGQGFRETAGDAERAEMVKRLAVCA